MAGEIRPELPLEGLQLHPMASGQRCLLLSYRVSWEGFPDYAEAIASLIGARLGRRIDSGGERVWRLDRDGLNYWITWDDLDPGVSIEPCDAEAGASMETLLELLLRARPTSR